MRCVERQDSMAAEWYFEREGHRCGPFSGAQMQELGASGRLTRDTLVRRGHDDKPVVAGEVTGGPLLSARTERNALAGADGQWDAGGKAGAVERYRGRLGSNSRSLKEGDKARVYGRVIDFDMERGDTESAKALLAEAVKKKVTPQVGNPEAKK